MVRANRQESLGVRLEEDEPEIELEAWLRLDRSDTSDVESDPSIRYERLAVAQVAA